ncbi:hypothetical protein L0Y40_01695 [Candidatus Wolfebacteria bacterium]|nr:hypothetical protein [Candidatus Wolfebacteria bacterium]
MLITTSQWEIHSSILPEETLYVTGTITNREENGEKKVVTFETETRDKNKRLLLRAKDTLLFLQNITGWKFKDKKIQPTPEGQLCLNLPVKVYFRHEWDPSVWKNNIHTDKYAQTLGYKRGLPEFTVFFDWIYVALKPLVPDLNKNSLRITLQKILPVYEDDRINMQIYRNNNEYSIHFLKDRYERILAQASLILARE